MKIGLSYKRIIAKALLLSQQNPNQTESVYFLDWAKGKQMGCLKKEAYKSF